MSPRLPSGRTSLPLPCAAPSLEENQETPDAPSETPSAAQESRPQDPRPEGVGRPPRTVLVLGGGGMRGMAHLGVLRAMRRLGLKPDVVVGTSIGALVGAMYAGGASVEQMEEYLKDVQATTGVDLRDDGHVSWWFFGHEDDDPILELPS